MVRHKMNKITEDGRSMTEMLGVLAIIGTLSISGIAGYTYAMNKHRANEIISSVSKMAMTATTEIDLHGNPSLVEFKKGGKIMTDNGYEVDLTEDNGDGTFTLTVKGVPKDVCEKIVSQDWKLPYEMPADCADGDNAMAFVFADSLDNGSGSADSGNSGNETGNNDEPNASGCPGDSQAEAIVGGTSFTVTSGSDTLTCYCPVGQSFQGKKCQNVPTTSCTSYTENECGLGYFCLFSSP